MLFLVTSVLFWGYPMYVFKVRTHYYNIRGHFTYSVLCFVVSVKKSTPEAKLPVRTFQTILEGASKNIWIYCVFSEKFSVWVSTVPVVIFTIWSKIPFRSQSGRTSKFKSEFLFCFVVFMSLFFMHRTFCLAFFFFEMGPYDIHEPLVSSLDTKINVPAEELL